MEIQLNIHNTFGKNAQAERNNLIREALFHDVGAIFSQKVKTVFIHSEMSFKTLIVQAKP